MQGFQSVWSQARPDTCAGCQEISSSHNSLKLVHSRLRRAVQEIVTLWVRTIRSLISRALDNYGSSYSALHKCICVLGDLYNLLICEICTAPAGDCSMNSAEGPYLFAGSCAYI